MRAIRVRKLGEPEVLRLESVADVSPRPGEVLVRLRAVGVNPVDGYLRAGIGAHPPLPYTPGTDGAGIVESVGAAAGFPAPDAGPDQRRPPRAGDRVYIYGSRTGAYAELALCEPQQVFPLPPALSFEEGAALGVPYGTAFRALVQLGGLRPGETVLVHGAGGAVGIAAVQIAADRGARVLATSSTEAGRRQALAQGATHALDHSDPEHLAAIPELTGGRGADLVIEMRSDLNLGADVRLLATGGRVICVGNRGPDNEGEVPVNARDLMRREGVIRGVMLPPAGHPAVGALHAELYEPLAEGRFAPVVSRTYPLEQASEAHRRLAEGSTLGKLVLLP